AFLLTISAGLLAVGAFFAMTLGRSAGSLFHDPAARDIWNVVRWPLAFAMLTGATACVFRWSPRRRQPEWSWLGIGAPVPGLPGAGRGGGGGFPGGPTTPPARVVVAGDRRPRLGHPGARGDDGTHRLLPAQLDL